MENNNKQPAKPQDLSREPLRPLDLSNFVGQTELKQVLSIHLNAAKQRGEALAHTAFIGPPGLGKTTLANIIASEMDARLIVASAPSITKINTLANLLMALDNQPGVLFMDEIHRLPRVIEEVLYVVMEDFRLDVATPQQNLNITLPHFTLVGATTRFGMLTKPLRDRFPHQFHLDYYTLPEIEAIIRRSARILKTDIDDNAVTEIAARSKRTPRIANNLLKASRDLAMQMNLPFVQHAVALGMFEAYKIDSLGLDRMDRKVLETIIDTFRGGPVGIDVLASVMGEEIDMIERVYEPYLIQENLIIRTPAGRKATQRAYEHLGKKGPGRQGVI